MKNGIEQRKFLYDSFILLFEKTANEEFDVQIDDTKVYEIIDNNKITIRCLLLLQALVDEYVCIRNMNNAKTNIS